MIDLVMALMAGQKADQGYNKAKSAGAKVGDAEWRIQLLEMDVDRLTLLNIALWEMLQAGDVLSDDNLASRVREVDLRDGVLDGKIRKTGVQHCSSCGKVLGRRHLRCIYCGSDALGADPHASVR